MQKNRIVRRAPFISKPNVEARAPVENDKT